MSYYPGMNTRPLAKFDENRRSHPRSYSVSNTDMMLISAIARHHECGKSEAVRMAVRFYALSLDLSFETAGEKTGGNGSSQI